MQLGDLLLQRHPRNEPLGPLTRCQGRVLPSGCGVRQGLSPRIEPGPDPRDSLGECECECECERGRAHWIVPTYCPGRRVRRPPVILGVMSTSAGAAARALAR